ncbi:hypothetical protein KI387_025338, partial [Taxus chinensis]
CKSSTAHSGSTVLLAHSLHRNYGLMPRMLQYTSLLTSPPTIYNNRLFYPAPCKFKSRSHDRRITVKSSDSSVGSQLGTDTQTKNEGKEEEIKPLEATSSANASSPSIEKELKKVVQKTAGTFAPRASTAVKNPAIPGTTLYSVFEVQGYLSMVMGGVLSFNLVFPSSEPDIWRLMGMWSIWMFTIPSLRARDCSKEEKEALNYLFLLIPLINVILPFFWKSFSLVWSADTMTFFLMYAWK